jgi:hypothetical protein
MAHAEHEASVQVRRRERGAVWSSREALGMKREALLDCFDTARGRYHQAWARTSVDIAIQACCTFHA